MSLKVYTGERQFAKPDEGKFFYQFASVLKKMFDKHDFEGMLFGAPLVKNYSYYKPDVVLFARNAIIVIDFKSHSGQLITPPDEKYRTGAWHIINNNEDIVVHGGKIHNNPYDQVTNYKTTLGNVLSDLPEIKDKYINTGVIFYGNKLNFEKANIPDRIKSAFFIADNDASSENYFYYNILSILQSVERDKSINLSDSDFEVIRRHFIVNEELDADFLIDNSGVSKKELEEKDRLIEEKDAAISNLRRKNKKNEEAIVQKNAELNRLASEKVRFKTELDHLKKFGNHEQINEILQKIQTIDRKMDKLEKGQAQAQTQTQAQTRASAQKKSRSFAKIVLGSIPFLIVILALTLIFIPKNDQANIKDSSISSPANLEKPTDLSGPYKAWVLDGDTISITNDGERQTVRLIGLEAPEVKSDYVETSECFGEDSKSYLINRIGGKEIYLEADDTQGDKDRYGRLLRYVWLDDELINQSILQNGYAKEYTYGTNYKYHDYFAQAQAQARTNSVGLWSKCQG